MALSAQTRAIVWAQSRALLQTARKAGFGAAMIAPAYALWYAIFCGVAALAAWWLANAAVEKVVRSLPGVFLVITAYWQLAPILVGTQGVSLDTRKLLAYPVEGRSLFHLDLFLRAMAGIEPLIVTGGVVVGALLNPGLPKWGVLAVLPLILFNMCVSSATKELMARVMARRRWREIGGLIFVLIAATPQIVIATRSEARTAGLLRLFRSPAFPWSAAAEYLAGSEVAAAAAGMCLWTAAAYLFARVQFQRGLRFDEDAARATPATARGRGRFAWFFEWPARVFPDPLAALVEKEIRVLARAPRFRMVFLMSFSFGVVMLMPLALNHPDGFMRRNFVVCAGAYALLLLGEVAFHNVFGFDRAAAQLYFAAPIPFRSALVAKNVAAFFYVLVEMVALTAVCASLRFIPNWLAVIEGFAIVPVLAAYFIAIGNLSSVHGPRPVDPNKSMRGNSPGKMQLMLLLAHPVAAAPVALAFVARWAFNSELAFFAVVAGAAVGGAAIYHVATESAVNTAAKHGEWILGKLSHGEGPIA